MLSYENNQRNKAGLLLQRIVVRMKQDQHYQPGSIKFRGNEDLLISFIQKYGKLVDSDAQYYEESSEKSWECVGSETMSSAAEVKSIFPKHFVLSKIAFCCLDKHISVIFTDLIVTAFDFMKFKLLVF